jgi:perosamine synthetase
VPGLRLVHDPYWGTTNYQSFWVRIPADAPLSRNEVLAHLAARGVSARRGIMASHLEPAYAGHPSVPLPVTEDFTANTLILPLFHDMTATEQDIVVEALSTTLAGASVTRSAI